MMPFYITRYRETKYNTYEKSPPTLTPYTLSRKSGFTLFLPVKMVKTGYSVKLQNCNYSGTYKVTILKSRRRHEHIKYHPSVWAVPASTESHSFTPVCARSRTREKDTIPCLSIVSSSLQSIPSPGCAWGADSSPSWTFRRTFLPFPEIGSSGGGGRSEIRFRVPYGSMDCPWT